MEFNISPYQLDLTLIEELRNERRPYLSLCQELNKHYFVRSHEIYEYQGVNQTQSQSNAEDNYISQEIYDSHQVISVEYATAGMQTGITPPTRPWFKTLPVFPDTELTQQERQYLDFTDMIQHMAYHRTNFYKETVPFYKTDLVFGTPLMYMEPTGDDDIAFFKTLRMGSYMISFDDRDNLAIVVREFYMTVAQMIQKFGYENLSESSQQLARSGNLENRVPVMNIVKKSDTYVHGNAFDKPYVSKYIESLTSPSSPRNKNNQKKGEEKYLKVSGFDRMPYYCTRWSHKAGDTYADTCPGITALPDVKALQDCALKDGQALAYEVHPHFLAHTSLRGVNTEFIPGGMSFASDLEALKGFRPAHPIDFKRDHILQKEIDLRTKISRIFFENLFLSTNEIGQRDRVTAREIESRDVEKFSMLAPALENNEVDFLSKVRNDFFFTLYERNLLPEIPETLQGEGFTIKSIGRLAIMQNQVALGELDVFKNTVMEILERNPESKYKINFDKFLDNYSAVSGISKDIVNSQEITEALRAADLEHQRRMEEAEGLANEARAVSDIATANNQGEQFYNAG